MTVLGRANHFVSTRAGPIARVFSRLQARAYERSGGRRAARFQGAPAFRLTVRGRKSGEPRSVMLMLVRRGDDLVVCGSNAGNANTPPWYLNLRAAGAAEVRVGAETWPVRAREVDGDERAECWRLLVAAYPSFETYQQLTARRLPVMVLERA